MRIHNFSNALNYAINEFNRIGANGKKSNKFRLRFFDENIRTASEYIQKIYEESGYLERKITEEELLDLIKEDYKKLIDEIYINSDIYNCLMKYLSAEYMNQNQEEIPEILAEAKKKNVKFKEDRIFTDDFHQNLLYSVLDFENNYNIFFTNITNHSEEFVSEMNSFTEKYGKIDGFVKFSDKYSKCQIYSITERRRIIESAYWVIFGIEGNSIRTFSKKDKISKYKATFKIKEYINEYTQLLKLESKEILIDSIMTTVFRLDKFGYILNAYEIHKNMMERLGLPGLKYVLPEEESITNPSIKRLVKQESLYELDIQDLVRMNSFYSNKLAKILEDYSKSVFFMESIGSIHDVLDSKIISSKSFKDDELEALYVKRIMLTDCLKECFTEMQNAIYKNKMYGEEDLLDEDGYVSIQYFVDEINEKWGDEYKTYFDEQLPEINNDLENDLKKEAFFYNGIFLSYELKTLSMKAEFACLSRLSFEKEKNFGIILEYDRKGRIIPTSSQKHILLASDGKTATNRLHVPRVSFKEFWKSINGNSFIRVYEGAEDLKFIDDDITNPLLLPFTQAQIKYLTDVKKGKLKNPKTSANTVTTFNEAFIDHMLYSMEQERVLKRHCRKEITFNKKGNPITNYYTRVRYLDFDTDILYELKDGELVEIQTKQLERSHIDE